jgi:hypothetical protein
MTCPCCGEPMLMDDKVPKKYRATINGSLYCPICGMEEVPKLTKKDIEEQDERLKKYETNRIT